MIQNQMKKSYSILLLVFLITPVFNVSAQTFTDPTVCLPGYIQGNVPTTQVPDYSYTSDGFLELHFRLTDAKWKYNFGFIRNYDQNCNLMTGGFGIWSDKQTSAWPGVNHLVLRYAEDLPGTYHFNAYNGDTGLPITLDTSTILGNFYGDNINYSTRPIVRIILGNRSATDFDWNTETGDLISTPALPMKITPRKTPVLIIPGVLGTDINKDTDKLWLDLGRNFTDIGDQFMDPLQFNTDLTPLDTSLEVGDLVKNPFVGQYFYDLIIQEFKDQNYTEGTNSDANLFTFPYDWRYGVSGAFSDGSTNVNLLRQKIQDIMTQTGSNKVDIIAHSTGGLLVKKYVMDHSSDNYIGKAVFVGVPNTGAPKAIKVLLKGDSFGIPWLADEEMQKLSQNFPIVYDLSPSQQYFNTKGSYVKIINQELFSSSSQDLDFTQASSFLTDDHNLNNQALTNAHNLHTANFDNFDMRNSGVDLYSINGCKAGTLSKLIERRAKDIFGNSLVSYDQPQRSPGDGTVPLESATNLPINQVNKYYALKADHGKMPSQDGIRQKIVNLISGSSLNVGSNLITQDISQCKLDGKAISIFSPLDIDITDQNGNHSGLASDGVSIENNIPNADFEIMGKHKFVYLPTDEGQTYTINLKGTGTGTFTLQNQNISNNKITQTETFTDLPVTSALSGTVNLNGVATTLSLDNNGDGTIDQTLQPSSLTYPDETPPEVVIQFNLITKDLQFSGTDNFSSPDKIKIQDFGSHVTLTDEASNILDVAFAQTNRKAALKADLKSLAYNSQLINLDSNLLSFRWRLDSNGALKSLTQQVKSRKGFSVKAVYDGNNTALSGQDQNGKINKTLNGMVLLKVFTDKGDLGWSY